MQNVRRRRPNDKNHDQERKQNAERRNHRRFRNIFRRLLSNRRRHDRCAGTKRENEKESREYSSALRISIERKYRRQRGKRGERKNGGGETEEDGYIDEREYDN